MNDATAPATAPWPAPRIAWTMVALLTLAYIFSFLDRYILGPLIEPIKADLHLSDTQIGLLAGPAFALFYATMGVPIGWQVDRRRRTLIVAAGVALWSLSTAASGLATGFATLFLARMCVGVGEATLSPSAMSMISDSFPPEKRGRPVAVYSAALSIGAGLASLITAAVLTWAKRSAGLSFPIVGALHPWQFTFLIVGLPGLLLALAFLLVPEPARRATAGLESGFGETLAFLRRNIGAFGGVTLLVCVMTILAYAQTFNAPAFQRTFGWEPRRFVFVNGLVNLAVGPLTVLAIGWLSDRGRAAGRRDAAFRLLPVSYVLMLPPASVALLMPGPALSFVMLGLSSIGFGAVTAAGIIALLDITPPAIRGQVVALYYMAISIIGLGFGPTSVGLLSTHVYGEANLRYAMATMPLLYGLVPLLLLPAIRRAYRARLEQTA